MISIIANKILRSTTNYIFENESYFSVIRINVIILYLKTMLLHDGDFKHAGNKLFLMILYTIADKKCLSYKQVDL